MRAGLYARVSTADQQTQNQLIELKRFCSARGYETMEFIEEPISGKYGIEKRPKLDELMESARKRRIDLVVTWDLARFARSMKQLVDYVDNLRSWNVGFTTIRENIDTTSANGRLVFHIFSGLAEFERELISERTKLGLRRATAEGKVLGRPRLSQDVSQVRMRLQKGKSYREIARELGVSKSWVAKVVSIKPPQNLASVS